jgi:hypothetical protein
MSERSEETVALGDAEVIAATEMAVLLGLDCGETWVPRSVLRSEAVSAEHGDYVEVVIQSWWAEREGLV